MFAAQSFKRKIAKRMDIFIYYFLYIMSTNSCSTNTLQLQMLVDLPAQPPITFDLAIETREGWPLLTVETRLKLRCIRTQ
jgi:hypothetical protein